MSTYVLVHGGWHGGWCWRDVAHRLRSLGHQVFAPTLTGLGERHHLIDSVDGPDTHVQDVANVIYWNELRDVILVGHSYGGMVTTGVASLIPELISHLVYLDAFVPTRPDQLTSQMSTPERTAEIAKSAQGHKNIPPSGFERWVSDPQQIAWLKRMTTPHPAACFGKGISTITDPSELDLLRTYILCSRHDPSPFQQFYERYELNEAWRCLKIDCLHDAMIERPDELTAMLTD